MSIHNLETPGEWKREMFRLAEYKMQWPVIVFGFAVNFIGLPIMFVDTPIEYANGNILRTL